ncbi:TRAP transporter substrate-binding protein [Clostridium sp. Marseille-P2415]|uniref:TRAP transporter substrate-binding protein n=1 Tax=Clostridium sp. Marseille-P2415 TaxID=1805471 RepID=UPI0009882F6E|nr:TRAP transporter substrate-binding protein [Clostridium sp. Marseille-P2415]
MRAAKTVAALILSLIMMVSLTGCGTVDNGKRIIRISNSQPITHPDNIGLLAFKDYVEKNLGDKYEVQIFPNELLGSSQKAIELVQTGAIEYVVSSTSNLETFNNIYQIFSLPYLFKGLEGFNAVIEDDDFMNSIYESTDESGFRAVAWYTAGVRNIYATKPIRTPDDLKGMKIRVQSSPTNVRMMDMMGAAAVPMSYGEVYTAIQQGVIDGAENSEMALTTMKHGEVAKYYTYNQHQIVPDLLVANLKFLESLTPEERAVFDEAAKISTQAEVQAWNGQIEDVKKQAEEMGVEFIETDMEPFRQKVLPLHEEVLKNNPRLVPIYDSIQSIQNAALDGKGGSRNE